MATPESKYDVSVSVKITEQGKKEAPFFELPQLNWNGVNYAGVVALQSVMVEALQSTLAFGEEVAAGLGQLEQLDVMLDSVGQKRKSKKQKAPK